jgi:hypothetical protein
VVFPLRRVFDARIRTDRLNHLMVPAHSAAFLLDAHLKKLTGSTFSGRLLLENL